MKYYKTYLSSEYDNLDLTLFEHNIRWSNDRSEFIVEFLSPPHGNTITLTHQEALLLMNTDKWKPINTELN